MLRHVFAERASNLPGMEKRTLSDSGRFGRETRYVSIDPDTFTPD